LGKQYYANGFDAAVPGEGGQPAGMG
jgi:hypothetical protein